MWILSVGLVLLSIYLFLKHVYSYWERVGIPHIKPSIPFGNIKDVAFRKSSIGMKCYDLYLKSKEPFVGVYLFFQPAILIRDAELARKVLTEDFGSFHDRGIYTNEERDPMSASLLGMRGTKWKNLRNKLTPAFTSGKLKGMFTTILDVGNRLDHYVRPHAENGETLDFKDMCSRYALDIVSSVIFGVEVDTINNPDHEFRLFADKMNKPSTLNGLKMAFIFFAPRVMEWFRIMGLDKEQREFMLRYVTNTAELREKHNVTRKDLMQLLLQYRNSGEIQEDGDWELKNTTNNKKVMSLEQIVGQAFLFYIAGSETSSSTMAFCLFELAQQPKLMARAFQEIDTILKKYNDEVTYDALNEMKFIEHCILETLRKYPGLPILNRECTKDYHIAGTKHVLKKGTPIVISLYGIHRDAKYFPEPDKFNPDRFLNENSDLNEKFFMPFGEGPRICVAYRMGKMVAKAGLVKMLSNYNFDIVGDTNLEYDAGAVTLVPVRGLPLKVTKRPK